MQKNEQSRPPQHGIKQKGPILLTTKVVLDEWDDRTSVCYSLMCTQVLFSLDDIPLSLLPAITNLL